MVLNFLKLKEIKNFILFFFIMSITTINIETFLTYFDEEDYELSASFEGYNFTGLFVVSIFLIVMYNWRLEKNFELITFVCIATVFRVLSAYLFAI